MKTTLPQTPLNIVFWLGTKHEACPSSSPQNDANENGSRLSHPIWEFVLIVAQFSLGLVGMALASAVTTDLMPFLVRLKFLLSS